MGLQHYCIGENINALSCEYSGSVYQSCPACATPPKVKANAPKPDKTATDRYCGAHPAMLVRWAADAVDGCPVCTAGVQPAPQAVEELFAPEGEGGEGDEGEA